MNVKLSTVCKEIAEKIPWTRSIVLIGSQARGEPSPLHREYDIIVAVPTVLVPLMIKKLKRMEAELSRKYELELSINPLPTFRIKHPKNNVLFYEMKYLGKVLYGEDILRKIPLGGLNEIPREFAMEYLFNTFWILLSPFSIRFFEERPYGEKRRELEYSAMKTFIQCCDALLILDGNYSFSLEERIRLVDHTFKTTHPELYKKLPDLPKLAIDAVEYRKGRRTIKGDSVRLWFLAKRHLEETMKYILKTLPRALNHGSFLENFLNNLQFIASQIIAKKKVELRMIGLESPAIKFRNAIFFLSCALSEETVNVEILHKALTILGKDNGSNVKNGFETWENLRNEVCEKWKHACTSMGW